MSDWPFLFDFARKHRGGRLALASLVAREGSSYRQPGARMLIAEDGSFSGSLSGGCLEEGIANAARQVFAEGAPRKLAIDTRPHFGCPGKLHVHLEEIPVDLPLEVETALRERRSVTMVTDDAGSRIGSKGADNALIEKIDPPVRLVVVGWTPDIEPVLSFAASLGWQRHRVVREQRMVAETPRVAGEAIRAIAAEELRDQLAPDAATAVLMMTHHLATDLAFLKEILPAGYGYVGLLGSRRRRETLLGELGALGLLEDPSVTDRFYAPVGLDLGGHHPASIALAIVAEIQAALAGAPAGFLRDRKGSIHSLPLPV